MRRAALFVSLAGAFGLAGITGLLGCTDDATSTPGGGTFEAGTGFDAANQPPGDAASGEAGDASDGAVRDPALRGIYVASVDNTVKVFALDATGNAAPTRTLSGASTGLALPIGVAMDSKGDLFVANRVSGAVTVYAGLASGDTAPTKTLTAPTMGAAEALAIGPGDDVYVGACPGCGTSGGGTAGIFHFPAGSTTSDHSIAGPTNTTLTYPAAIALDEAQNLIVGNPFGGDVATFAPGVQGDVAPIRTFAPAVGNLQSIAYGNQTIFVTSPGLALKEFAANATGTPTGTTITTTSLPVSYPGGITVDTSVTPPVLYLVDYTGNAIHVVTLAGSAPSYTVASIVTITGAATTLNQPLGILVVK